MGTSGQGRQEPPKIDGKASWKISHVRGENPVLLRVKRQKKDVSERGKSFETGNSDYMTLLIERIAMWTIKKENNARNRLIQEENVLIV